MAQTIKLKRGTTTPTTSNIVSGEVAIDTAAQKLYINDAGTIKEIGGGGASGFSVATITTEPSATGTDAIAIGDDATAAGNFGVAVGDQSAGTGAQSSAYGAQAKALGTQSTSLGYRARSNNYGVSIGPEAGRTGTGTNNILIGYGAGYSGSANHNLQISTNLTLKSASETGAILIETSKAKIEYTAANGFVFTEDVGGTNTSYDLSSLGGGGGLTQAKSTAISLIFG